jgi:hypothetical protein
MVSPLPGRAGIIDLFEKCVTWPRPRGRQLPIALLLGPAGSGKTDLLRELDRLAREIPHAYTDLATINPRTPVDVMVDLVIQLSIGNRRLGRLRFPRFWVGLLVTRLEQKDLSPEDRRVAVRNLLNSIRRFRRIPAEVRDLFAQLVTLTGLAPPVQVTDAIDTATRTLRLLHGPAERWWAGLGNQSAVDALLRLKVTFDRGTQIDLRDVEEKLCTAFLADLRAEYTNTLRGPDRTVAAVALLDNVHGTAGKAFLELLARVRSAPESRPDPLLVVAASRHTLCPELFTGVVTTPEAARGGVWEERFDHTDWRSRFYPVRLRDLSRDEVERLAELHGLRSRGSLASFVHRLTAGHPGGVRAVLDLLAGSSDTSPRAMLEADPGLLDALLVDVPKDLREDLITCAAARQVTLPNLRAALGAGADDDRQTAQDLSTVMRELHWLTASTGELHPWLRRLLLLRLERRQDEDPSSWARVHGRLADHHRAAGDPTGELYHRLAVGEVEQVVRELDRALSPERPTAEWLATFTAVTSAPNAVENDDCPSTPRRLASWADGEERRVRDLAWLVPANWLESDPLADPFAAFLPKVAARWQELSGEVPHHADALFDRGQEVKSTAKRHGDLVESLAAWNSGSTPLPRPARPPVKPRTSARRHVLRAVAAVLPVALATAWIVPDLLRPGNCAEGVESHDGECIGVTNGEFEFHDQLKPVMRLIREANEEVGRGKDVVTVVAAVAVPHDGASMLSIDTVVHELQGAYVAQYQANVRTSAKPKIRMLVANVGDHADHWDPVLDQLADLEDLSVVVELGPSRANGRDAMLTLGARGVPTMAAIITSDDVHGDVADGGIRRFARVAPTNGDQVTVGISTQRLDSARTLLIKDSNPDDLYTTTLAEHFLRLLPGTETETFETTQDGVADVAVRMRNIVNEICSGDYEWVYFAGRSAALRQFVIELGDRHCNPNLPVTVVTADDATVIDIDRNNPEHERFATALRERQVTVLCTALAHPDQWRGVEGSESDAFVWFADHYDRAFPEEPLDDGQAMMTHDAIVTAVEAIRDGGHTNIWLNMHGENRVPGVTGPIELDEHGNTIGKRIPILRLEPDGSKSFVTLGVAGR